MSVGSWLVCRLAEKATRPEPERTDIPRALPAGSDEGVESHTTKHFPSRMMGSVSFWARVSIGTQSSSRSSSRLDNIRSKRMVQRGMTEPEMLRKIVPLSQQCLDCLEVTSEQSEGLGNTEQSKRQSLVNIIYWERDRKALFFPSAKNKIRQTRCRDECGKRMKKWWGRILEEWQGDPEGSEKERLRTGTTPLSDHLSYTEPPPSLTHPQHTHTFTTPLSQHML